jgi:hypothetical protein
MDLLHYAMVGGMTVEELPEEDQEKYHRWFQSIPETQQKSYDYASLENVLDIHASKLYESAANVYNQQYSDEISVRDAKNILAITFACLTKIDQSRAVRNRMTLQEITNIINKPEFDSKRIGRVINIFRKEGNTFIRPFLMDGDEEDIPPETVLDITHESLIRNWKRLLKWVNQEFAFYEDFVDFRKQLDRWVDSGKSRDFLLPLGPLTYFENWFEECKPNQYWIARYSEDQESKTNSKITLANAIEFLKRSGQKHLVSKTFMKYGAQRIGVVFAIILSIFLSSFYYNDALDKQNEQVLNQVLKEGEEYLNNTDNIPNFTEAKANYLLSILELNPKEAFRMLNSLSDPVLKVEVPVAVYSELIKYNRKFVGDEKDNLLNVALRNVTEAQRNNTIDAVLLLRNLNTFLTALNYDLYFNQNKRLQDISQLTHVLLKDNLLEILNGVQRDDFNISQELSVAVRHLRKNGDNEQNEAVLSILYPFEDDITNVNH